MSKLISNYIYYCSAVVQTAKHLFAPLKEPQAA